MISDSYRAQLRAMHERRNGRWGDKGFKHADVALRLAAGGSILDYGSGMGTLRQLILQLHPDADVRNYDPGIPEDSAMPVPADVVICTDVLEHIEPDHLDEVLQHIFSLARRAIYLQIALFPAKKTLPDGRNAHLIVQPTGWWLPRVTQAANGSWAWKVDGGKKHLMMEGTRR